MTEAERIAKLETTSDLTYQLLQKIDEKLDAHISGDKHIMTRAESFNAFALKDTEKKVLKVEETLNKGLWVLIPSLLTLITGLIYVLVK